MDFLSLLPLSLRPYAKAVTPAVLAVLAAIVHGLTTGAIRTTDLEIAVVGLLAASVTFAVANAPIGLRRYLKAIAPAALTVVGVLVHWLVTGSWNDSEWTLAITGLGAAIVALLVPNAPGPVEPGVVR